MSPWNSDNPELPVKPAEPVPGGAIPVPTSGALTPVRVHPSSGQLARATPVPPALSGVPNAWALAKALRRRWLQALTLGLLSAALVATVTWYVVPRAQYTAQARLQILSVNPRIIFKTDEAQSNYTIFQRTQVELIKSKLVLTAALRQPHVAQLTLVQEQTDAIEWLEKELQVAYSGGSEILRIALSGDNPQELAAIVNAVKESYLTNVVDSGRQKRIERLTELKNLYGQFEADLIQRRNTLRKFAKTAGSGDAKVQALREQFLEGLLRDTQKEAAKAEGDLRSAQLELKQLQDKEKQLASLPILESAIADQIDKDASIQGHVRRMGDLEKGIKGLEDSLNEPEKSPEIRIKRGELLSLKNSLPAKRARLRPVIEARLREERAHQTKSAISQLEDRIPKLENVKKMREDDHKQLEEAVGKFNVQFIDNKHLQQQMEQIEKTATTIGNEIQNMEVELKAPPRVTKLDDAESPRTKDVQKPLKMAGMAGTGAFALVVLGIAFLEFRARRIDTPDEVVNTLGMRLIGALPGLPSRSWPGRLRWWANDEGNWQSLMTESVDTTRTMLLHAARVESLRVVMVTSAVSGEGKTSLACHLAASLARAGRKTLLLDCDLRKPSAHELFDRPLTPGLSEVLRGEVELAQAIRQTPMDGLWLVAAGERDSEAIQALALEPIERVFRQLREQYDFIVVDSCPVLPTADSLLVSQHVDAVLFSILREVSQMPKVYAAYQRLAVLGARMLGAVVNGAQGDSYGTGYGYAYQSRG